MMKFLKSLRQALNGISYAFASERNLKIQLVTLVLVLMASLAFNISRTELLLVLGVSALVLSLELTNTAVERLADEVSSEYRREIGIIKDVMAGAVLVASIFAVILGLMVFSGPMLQLLRS